MHMYLILEGEGRLQIMNISRGRGGMILEYIYNIEKILYIYQYILLYIN